MKGEKEEKKNSLKYLTLGRTPKVTPPPLYKKELGELMEPLP